MRRLRLALVAVFATTAVVAAVGAVDSARGGSLTIQRSQLVDRRVYSPALEGALRFEVWLPRDYASHPKRRYPVLYVLHGLPGDEHSYKSLSFLAPVLHAMRAQAIVVFPQGARSDAPDDEYQDLGPGRSWETALTEELPEAIAARYRTLPGRDARGILGVSAGGYGAMTIGLHHLGEYSVVESWSGYFHATTPDGSAPKQFAQPGKAAYADLHRLVSGLATAVRKEPTLIGFFTGSNDPYPGFTAENRQFDSELTAAHVAHTFAVYRGGHDTNLWLAHARGWLTQALKALTPAAG